MESKVILFGIEKMIKMSRNISGKVKVFVFERDKGNCVYCGSTESLEFDHIIPASKGGSNTERNIQLVCMKCNRVKFNYIDDDDILKKKNKPKLKKKNNFEEIIISKKKLSILNWNDDDNISVLIDKEGKMSIIKNRIKGYHTKVSINQEGYGVVKIPLNVMFAWLFNLKKDLVDNYSINIVETKNGQKGLFLFKREEKKK